MSKFEHNNGMMGSKYGAHYSSHLAGVKYTGKPTLPQEYLDILMSNGIGQSISKRWNTRGMKIQEYEVFIIYGHYIFVYG